ncbi:MAG: hypothetical protein ACRDY0_07840, partial [Acidimicrobiales bacterium]
PEVDDHMAGARAGDILSFEATHPDGPVQLRVLVKEVQEKILPEVTDEWVSEASEFDTVQELRADIVGQLARAKRMQATMAMNDAVVAALVDLVSDEPPEAMVSSEIERRVYDLQQRLESQGASLDRYLAATGKSPEEVLAEIRPVAVAGVRADLALRAVAEAEGIDGGGEVLDAEMEVLARNYKMTPDALRAALESSGRMAGVRSDLLKRRALEWVVEHAELVSEEGEPIDRSLLARPEPATAAPPGATPAVAASAGPIPGLPTDPGQTDPVSPDRSESDHA